MGRPTPRAPHAARAAFDFMVIALVPRSLLDPDEVEHQPVGLHHPMGTQQTPSPNQMEMDLCRTYGIGLVRTADFQV